jgi:hypothetical protein
MVCSLRTECAVKLFPHTTLRSFEFIRRITNGLCRRRDLLDNNTVFKKVCHLARSIWGPLSAIVFVFVVDYWLRHQDKSEGDQYSGAKNIKSQLVQFGRNLFSAFGIGYFAYPVTVRVPQTLSSHRSDSTSPASKKRKGESER